MKIRSCVVFWHGFPSCGHMLKNLSDLLGDGLTVIATRPALPFHGVGDFLHNKIIYLNSIREINLHWGLISSADIFIHTGWCYKDINVIDKKIKHEKLPTRIYVLVDNRLKYSIRQFFGFFLFRLFFLKKYDGYIVAGKKSKELLNFFGVEEKRIASGHYGAPEDFYPRRYDLVPAKKDQFIFVGSLDKRKGFDLIIQAWKKYVELGGKWRLLVIGSGPLHSEVSGLKNISYLGFRGPNEVARSMQDSRALLLPGRDDNWATVLAEAAASGCILVSTYNVGATYDLVENCYNGYILPNKFLIDSIVEILDKISTMDTDSLEKMAFASIRISENFKSLRLTDALMKLESNV